MIRSFADRETAQIAHGLRSRRFPAEIQARARLCLERLDAATHPGDLQCFRSMRIKRLKGEMSRFFSIRINNQYRIVFLWTEKGAEKVRLVDYH